MSSQGLPLCSMTGVPICMPPRVVGDALYVEFRLPVLTPDEENHFWRAFYNIEHDEFEPAGNQSAIEAVVDFVREQFMGYLGPVSLQRAVDAVRRHLSSFDLRAMMPPNIPVPHGAQAQ